MKPRRLSPPGSEKMVSRFLQEQPHVRSRGDCSGSPHAPQDPLSPGSQTPRAAEPLPCALGRAKPAQSKRGEGLLGTGDLDLPSTRWPRRSGSARSSAAQPQPWRSAAVAVAFVCQRLSCRCCARLSRDRCSLSRAPQCRRAGPRQAKLILLEINKHLKYLLNFQRPEGISVVASTCIRKGERKRHVINCFSTRLCSVGHKRAAGLWAAPSWGMVPETPRSPLGTCVCALETDPSNRVSVGWVTVPIVHDGNLVRLIAAAPTVGRTALSPPAFARLPVGVLPPPVGQHQVCVGEDGGQPEGLRDLPEGDSDILGQDLQGTKHRTRQGHCWAGHAPAAAPGKGLCCAG